MFKLRGYLYLGCFFCLAAGVEIGRYAGPLAVVSVLCLVVVSAASLALAFRNYAKVFALTATFFIVGAVLMYASAASIRSGVLPRMAAKNAAVKIEGRIVSASMATGEGSAFFVEVAAFRSGGVEYKTRERFLLRLDSPVSEKLFFPGAQVQAEGSLRVPKTDRDWLFNHGAACVMNVGARRLKAIEGSADLVSRSIRCARAWMSKSCRRIYSPKVAGFIEGVALSKLDGLDSAVLADLRSCGLGHIVAVSGLHVGSAVMLALALLMALGAGRRKRYFVACIVALFVLAVSNFRPSALRASIMAGACFGGIMVGREYDSLVGLDLAGIFILCANPRAVFDPGFQFSFAAALGIVLALGMRRKKGQTGGVRMFLAVSAGAQLGIVPLMLLNGEAVPVTAVAANLLAVPLVGFLLVAGWGSAVVTSVNLALGKVIAAPVSFVARFILAVASTLSKIPRSGLVGGTVSTIAFVVYLIALIGFIKGAREGGSIFRPAVATITAVILMLVPCVPVVGFQTSNRMTVLDVGEGDAILVQDSTGTAVLVDGGPDGEKLIEKLQARGVRKLDAIVLSHPHSDHISGLLSVMRMMPVGHLIDPGLPADSAAYRELLRLARDKRVPRSCAVEGQVVEVSRLTELDIMYAPDREPVAKKDLNDSSVVVMVRLAGMRALMTGDVGSKEQAALISFHPDLSCDVLKISHHGAREAALQELYAACRPAVATISVGRNNKFAHPSRRCLELLADRRITVARTDRDGDVEISVDNGKIGVITGRR